MPALLDKARAQPGKINFASFGANTSGGLATEMIKLMAKVDVLHVPFNGSAPAIQALLGGNVDLMFDTAVTALPLIKSGKVVVLGVSSAKRTRLAPELPTVGEAIPGFEADSWNGLMAPTGTPPEIVDRIQREVAKFVVTQDVRRALRQPRCRCASAARLRSSPRTCATRRRGTRVWSRKPTSRSSDAGAARGRGPVTLWYDSASFRNGGAPFSRAPPPFPLGNRWH